jgi:NAD kinase
MMSTLPPRIVLVTRETELQALMARHATLGQARFYLEQRGQTIETVQARHELQSRAIAATRAAVPEDWTFAHVERGSLDRFLFAENDMVVALGQDGLVANLAKYLTGQPVLGVTPDAASYESVLTIHEVQNLAALFRRLGEGNADISSRPMVEASIDSGTTLLALNEVFIGHRTHQSAKYVLRFDGAEEFQSSSGVIFATGTGMTGWAKSIVNTTHSTLNISPSEAAGAFFVREPWPSKHTGATLQSGLVAEGAELVLASRINEGGVIFADGIEQDFLHFNWGSEVRLGLAAMRLNLVV